MAVQDRGGREGRVGPFVTFVEHVRPNGALAVVPGQVGDAAGGWEAFERGVSPVMVVGVEPGVKGGAPFGL